MGEVTWEKATGSRKAVQVEEVEVLVDLDLDIVPENTSDGAVQEDM